MDKSLYMHWVSGLYYYLINTQHKDFHYLICLYSCKTVVFIIIYSFLEIISELDASKSSQYISELDIGETDQLPCNEQLITT